MSTAGEEHHRSRSAGHIVMGLVAGVLALIAVYLWLTDGSRPWLAALKPSAPSPAAVAATPPADHSSVALRRPAAPSESAKPVPAPGSVAATPDAASLAQTGTTDSQVAADAAAAGMTSRLRPNDSAAPVQ